MRAAGQPRLDAVIIGGGFYGCAIALYLARQRGLRKIVLVEREPTLLARASYHNQARVHNGYHYPRSFTTAYRSRINLPQFVRDWPGAVKRDFTKLYAIARRNSKVTAPQFQRFCRAIGARLEPAEPGLRQLFDARLIEAVFVAEEYAFDALQLAAWARTELAQCGVEVLCETEAGAVAADSDGLRLRLASPRHGQQQLACDYIFNCSYSGLNQIGGAFPGSASRLKHEITELALVALPSVLAGLGITVMDGPFFSLLPFAPREGLHTLSHVRYSPHLAWQDQPGVDPYARLRACGRESRVERMLRDGARYLPDLARARHADSLFEIKTVLVKNEVDDGRPILFEKHAALPGCYSILGGKIDNIYDVLERLDDESF